MCCLAITPAADGAKGSPLAKEGASSLMHPRGAADRMNEISRRCPADVPQMSRRCPADVQRRRGVRGCSGGSSLTPPPLLSLARYGPHLDAEMTTLAAFRPRRCYRRECLCRTVQNRRLDLITISSPANLALDAAAKRQRGLRAMFPPLPPEHRCVPA